VKRLLRSLSRFWRDRRGGVFVEYILLLTIVGLGAIVGLAVLRNALIDELNQLAQAIAAIILP
jgi:pilus assembly protein Flp/PilA